MDSDLRCAILATGPSMSQELADGVSRTFSRRIVISDAWELDPGAECLVSTDVAWWNYHKPDFKGKKFCGAQAQSIDGVTAFGHRSDINSGCLAIQIARKVLGCKEVYLFGFDMSDANGSHYFGEHPAPLKKTPPERWGIFHQQFAQEAKECEMAGLRVYNCTPGSALKCFHIANPFR